MGLQRYANCNDRNKMTIPDRTVTARLVVGYARIVAPSRKLGAFVAGSVHGHRSLGSHFASGEPSGGDLINGDHGPRWGMGYRPC